MFALIAPLGKRYCWKLKKADTFFIFAHITKVSSFSLQNTLPKKNSHSKTHSLSTVQNSISLSKMFHSPSVKVRKHFPSPKTENHFLALVTHSLEIEVGIKNAISKRLDLHSLDLPSLYYAWITYLRVLSSFQLIPENENGKSFICRLHV